MRTRPLTLALVILIASTFGFASTASGIEAKSPVTIVDEGFDWHNDVVPSNLSWSKKSIDLAKQAQRFLFRTIKNELNAHKDAGAVRIVRLSSSIDPGVRNWRKLNLSGKLYSLNGYDENDKLVRKGKPLFSKSQSVQHMTVYLTQQNCLLKSFNIFDFETWFSTQCSITVESKEKFLRASLQSWISLVGGFNPDGRAVQNELENLASQTGSFRMDRTRFYCLKCSFYSGHTYSSFPLEYKKGVWPYKIEYSSTTQKFIMTIFKPNWADLMSKVYLQTDDVLRFEDRTGFDPLFPFVS
jgi:hypothetical protein